jgi:hypothetical protein
MTKEQLKNIFGRGIGSDAYWTLNKHLVGHLKIFPTLLLQHLVDVHQYKNMNNYEWFYQQYSRIALDLHCDEKTIQRNVNYLKGKNLLETKFEKDKKDYKMKTWFKINYGQIAEFMDTETPKRTLKDQGDFESTPDGLIVQTNTKLNNTNHDSCLS